MAPRRLYVVGAPFELASTIIFAAGRYKFLQVFEIVQKHYGNARDYAAIEQ